MENEKKKLGKEGEDLACSFLEKSGHKVIFRNYRKAYTEIDIITLDRAGIHFVEVKTRKAPSVSDPEDAIDFMKKRNLARAAQDFIHSENCPGGDCEFFFDVVSVWLFDDHSSIQYYPKAFIPMYV